MRHLESQLQQDCVKWFRYQYPDIAKLLFAVPNGGRRGKFEAAIMQGEGVTPGVSDCILLVPKREFAALCIEFKRGKGKQTDLQKQWQELAEKHGNKYVVCRSFEEFTNQINDYLKLNHQ